MSDSSSRDYRVIAPLARGGMGTVDLVLRHEAQFARLYARKHLRPEHRGNETVRIMFLEEARIAGLLRHPNVVSVLDVGEDQDGPFLIMDYVDGLSLSAIIKAAAASTTLLPLTVCLEITRQLCRGLAAAHDLCGHDGAPLRLVHRDVSPQNVLVGFDGVVRVTDFGIAKVIDRDMETTSNLLKGKIGYMSPEQLRFERIDTRSDLFSLGVVLFELLTLRRVYRGGSVSETARRILHDDPPDLGEHRSDAPPELVELVFALMARSPEDRPATAGVVANVLRGMLDEAEVTEGRVDLEGFMTDGFSALRERRRKQREEAIASSELAARRAEAPRKRWLVAAALVVALFGAAFVALWQLDAPSNGGPSAEAPERARVPAATANDPEAPAAPEPAASEETPSREVSPDTPPARSAGAGTARRPRARMGAMNAPRMEDMRGRVDEELMGWGEQ